MARKTVAVARLIDKVNQMNAASSVVDDTNFNDHGQNARIALNVLIENVLHETGNYKGFRYQQGYEAVQSGNYDDTRRHYFGGTL